MNNIVLYCKSYRKDFDRLVNLVNSINQFNIDKIPFYVSVPIEDIKLFKQIDNIELVADNDIIIDNKEGWTYQQIVKANFWKLGICENYLCLDSDSYFIRDFRKKDFLYNDSIPYTVIHEQKELFSWTVTKKNILGFDPKESFLLDRKKIMIDVFNRQGKYYDFGPSPVIWSCKVWKDLEEKYILPNNIKFRDLIEYSPSEFSWYGESLLNFKSIDLYPIEPIFKVFHYAQQYDEYKQQGITEDMISQNYMGIILQSNYNSPLKY